MNWTFRNIEKFLRIFLDEIILWLLFLKVLIEIDTEIFTDEKR